MDRMKTGTSLRRVVAGALIGMASAAHAQAPVATAPATDWQETYAYTAGLQALVYGYPVVRNTMARYGMVERPTGQVDSPVHGFYHQRLPGTSADKYGSSITENLLYSAAWYDVSKEPLVVTVPAAGERYLSVQMMEMYSDIFGYLGLRTTGNRAGSHLVVGPQWHGEKPAGIASVLRSPTPTGLLLLRIAYDSRDNLAPAHAVQDGTTVAPLSYWQAGKPFVASVRDVTDPVPPKSDPLWFFRTLNRALTENPPPPEHAALVAGFRRIGLGAGLSDDLSTLDAPVCAGLARAQADGLALLARVAQSGGGAKRVNQWVYGDMNWGRMAAASDFLGRATPQSFAGMQEHHIEEVVKLRAHHDADGRLLDGTSYRYVVRFSKDQIPHAKAFWSITLYDDKYDLAANDIGRYSRGSPDKEMIRDADGSLEILLQHEPPPPERRANWLPTPKGPFNLFLRAYLPGHSLQDQSYVPPAVQRVADGGDAK